MPRSEQQPGHSISVMMEVIEVFDDYLKCEERTNLFFMNKDNIRQDCPECDEGEWQDEYASAAECRRAKAECVSEGVLTVYVAKPLHLQKGPWDAKTIKYNAGQSDEFTITYTYQGTNTQKRVAKYSAENERCSSGDHVEVIWPPYRARIDPSGENDKKVAGYVQGDIIQVTKMLYGKADVGVRRILDAAEDEEQAKANLAQGRVEAQYAIDNNVDGRKWSDDCGKGGGGGSVWV